MKITVEIEPTEAVEFIMTLQEKGLETFLKSIAKPEPQITNPWQYPWGETGAIPCGGPLDWWNNQPTSATE